jgi:predicted CXXCH cytochrome family protein
MIDPHRWSEATVNDHHPVNGTVATTQPGTGTGNHTLQATDETKPGCLSCHMMHRSPAPQRLLKHAYEGSELCHECHAQQQQVTDTPHNLAHTAPDVQNLHGVTAVQGGSCSACHGIHDPARKAVKVVGDPNGQCVTCHRNDGCANAVHETEGSHPLVFSDDQLPGTMSLPTEPIADANRKQVACNACHRPHDNSLTRFLQQKPDALCGQCHSDHVQQVKGGHDIASTHPDATNATGFNADQTGTCGFCHGFHRGARPSLWSASDDPVDRPNDVCLHCHQESALAADMIAGAVLHPQGQYTEQTLSRNKLSLPLFDQQLHQQQQGQLACATCHDVHANSQINPAMLRANPARGQTFRWCGSCHEQADRLTATLHDERFIQAHGSEQDGHFKSGFCQPCHAVHAPAGVDPKKIDAMLTAPVGNDSPPGAGQCLGCHQEAGGASAVRVTVHPDLPMHNLSEPGTPGYLPLADAAGSLHGGGQITCRTCHLPHGQHGEPALDLTDPSEISENQLRGLRWMVRPFTAPNLCTGCHGMTGLTYYLYWHQPEKRLQPTTMSFSPVKSE